MEFDVEVPFQNEEEFVGVVMLVPVDAPRFEDGSLQDRLELFNGNEIGRFWPPERRLVDQGYADIDFPFAEFAVPSLSIQRQWNLDQVLGYVSTWSALKRALQAGETEIVHRFECDLRSLWQQREETRSISWPIVVRAGTIE